MSYKSIQEKTMTMLTLRIDDKLDSYLNELTAATGKTKSEIAREALTGHVFRTRWKAATEDFGRHARSMGIYTEEDVMRICNEAREEDRAASKLAKSTTSNAA
jgi:predicted transcriptional regulator